MTYGSIEQVRLYSRGITDAKVSDADITAFLEAMSSIIDLETGHSWDRTTGQIEYHDGDSHDELLLNPQHRPIILITSIEKRTTSGWRALTVFDPETAVGDYWLEELAAGIIRWTSGERATNGTLAHKITFDYGYDPTPEYIDQLASMLAAISTLALAAGVVSPDGLVSISEGALSLSWGGGPYQETISLLERGVNEILKVNLPRRVTYVNAG